MKLKLKRNMAMLAALAVGIPAGLRANVIAYEGFNDGAASDALADYAGSGEIGLVGVWTNNTGQAVTLEEPTTSQVGITNGVSVSTNGLVISHSAWSTTRATRGLESEIDFSVDGTTYVSFFAASAGDDFVAQVGFANNSYELMAGQGWNRGLCAYYGSLNTSPDTGNDQVDLSFDWSDRNIFIVAEFEKSDSDNSDDLAITLYAYDLGNEADYVIGVPDVTRTVNLTGVSAVFDRLQFKSDGWNELDEIRVGETFLDVTGVAEPSIPLSIESYSPEGAETYPLPVIYAEIQNNDTSLDTGSVFFRIDGNTPVAPDSISETNGLTTVCWSSWNEVLDAESEHSVELTFSDDSAMLFTNRWSFTVAAYATLPAEYAGSLSATNGAERGFWYRDVGFNGSPSIDSLSEAEDALRYRGEYAHPSNDVTTAVETDGAYRFVNDVINYGDNTSRGEFNSGNGYSDSTLPGTSYGNLAFEIRGYLELDAGLHTIGINDVRYGESELFFGDRPFDLFASTELKGSYSSSSGGFEEYETVVQVTEPGLYPFRMVCQRYSNWGYAWEFYTKTPAGDKVLINDDVEGSIKIWRASPILNTYVASMTPEPEANITPDQDITILLGGTNSYETIESVSLNGAPLELGTDAEYVYDEEYTPYGVQVVDDSVLIVNETNRLELIYLDLKSGLSFTNDWFYQVANYIEFAEGSLWPAQGETDVTNAPLIQAGIVNYTGTLNADSTWVVVDGITNAVSISMAASTNLISFQAQDLLPGEHQASLLYAASEGGGLNAIEWTFTVDEYVELYSIYPGDSASEVSNAPLIEASFINRNGMLDYVLLYLDGVEVANAINTAATNVVSYQAADLAPGSEHVVMVIYYEYENPDAAITNISSFTVAGYTQDGRYMFVEDFESYTAGRLSTYASPPWYGNTGGASIGVDASSQRLTTGYGGYLRGAWRELDTAVLAEGETATYYFQIATSDSSPGTYWGLVNAIWGASTFEHEAVCGPEIRLTSGTGGYALKAMDGTNEVAVADGLSTANWIEIWMVVDNAADTYDVYYNIIGSDRTAGSHTDTALLGQTGLAFRQSTTSDLTHFIQEAYNGNQSNLSAFMDNLRVDMSGSAPSLADISVVSQTPSGIITNGSPVVEMVMVDYGITVNTNLVELLLDGNSVAASMSKDGSTTTVSYALSDLLPGTHSAVVIAGPGTQSNAWSFTYWAPAPAESNLLFNVNMAGKGSGTQYSVADGTVVRAPSTDANVWNNIGGENDAANEFPVSDASGRYAIHYSSSGDTEWSVYTGNSMTVGMFQGWCKSTPSYSTLSGLDSSAAYDLYVYSTWGWTEQDVTYEITAGYAEVTSGVISMTSANVQGDDYDDYSGLVEGENYIVLSDITPTVDGEISFTVSAGDGVISAFQLVQKPGEGNIPVVESPIMSLIMPGGSLMISWPVSSGNAFNVLTNADLVSGQWGAMDTAPYIDGDNYVVTNLIGAESQLFMKLESK